MVWFRKRESGAVKAMKDTREKILMGFAKGLQKVQRKWADWMNRQVARLSLKSQKIVFVVWAALMFLACSYTIVSNTVNRPSKVKTSNQMKLPRLRLQQPASRSIEVSDEMYQRVRAFKRKMDSLGRTQHGQLSRDSLLKTRPGLMDSIKMVEQLYGKEIN
jgi:hypothetical protein